MKTPQWLATAVADSGVNVLGGSANRAEAEAAVIAATRDHPEFLAELGAAMAVRLLGKWIGEHESGGDLFQTQMFPGLPAAMRVAPKRSTLVADMTAEDLDHAKNMLWARTKNQMDGAREAAEHEREVFMAFYGKVRPLLSGGLTVSEAIGRLAERAA